MNRKKVKNLYPIEKYGALFDAHIHTYFDYHDGLITPKQLIKCTLKRGFNYVCAMAHDTIRGTKIIERLARGYNLPSVPAMEVSTVYNHILAFGVQEWPFRRNCLDPDVAIEYLREQDCAIFLAHPYSDPHNGLWIPEVVKRLDIDGIEWTNSTAYWMNWKTHKVFQHMPIGRRIAGSDAHTPAVFGTSFTQVNINSEDPDDLVAAMKNGKCRAYSSHAPLHRALYMVFLSILRNNIIKRRWVEGRHIIPEGDHPRSIVPHQIKTSAEWVKKILQKPENSRTKKWIDGK
ncbi:MAG: CehA/McbA family metallohydrolase [Promethearchaeota archaeon]